MTTKFIFSFGRRIMFTAAAFTVSAPLFAQATEVRFFGHLDLKSRDALRTLSESTRFGAKGTAGDKVLALAIDGQITFLANDKSKPSTLSPETVDAIVKSGACDLELVGPCFVNENNVTTPIGVRTNSLGVSEVVAGNYKLRYVKRTTKVKGKLVTTKRPHLQPWFRFLNKANAGRPLVYTTVISPYHVKEAQRAYSILNGYEEAEE